MRTNLLKGCALSLLVLSATGFISCSEEDISPESIPTKLGTIQVDRNLIGACQPFRATCAVTAGENIVHENFTWRFGSKMFNNITEKGQVSAKGWFEKAGSNTIRLEYSSAGISKIFTDAKELSVTVVPTDVRNSFWGESQEETLSNLEFYNTLKNGVKNADFLKFDEFRDMLATSSIPMDRTVSYFYEKNQLASVLYVYNFNDVKDAVLISRVAHEMDDIQKEGFENLENSYEVKEGETLTTEEKKMVDLYLAKTKKSYDKEGVLGKAVKTGKIVLLMKGSTDKTSVLFEIKNTEENEVLGKRSYLPNK